MNTNATKPKHKRFPSTAKLRANRRNARRSTGPRSAAGKARSSQNARRHGLLAENVLLPAGCGAENRAEFQALLADVHAQFRPEGVVERALVDRIAACFWRIRRAQKFEVGTIRESLEDPQEGGETASLEVKLQGAIDHRDLLVRYREFLETLDPTDEQAVQDAAPTIERIRMRFYAVAGDLPLDRMRGQVLRALSDEIRRIEEREIPDLHAQLDRAKAEAQARRERRLQIGALPQPADVLTLVRYENMLDRQLHRALARLRTLQRARLHPNEPDNVDADVTKEEKS